MVNSTVKDFPLETIHHIKYIVCGAALPLFDENVYKKKYPPLKDISIDVISAVLNDDTTNSIIAQSCQSSVDLDGERMHGKI